MAALSSFGSILPPPSESNKSNASLISNISSSDKPGLSNSLASKYYSSYLFFLTDLFPLMTNDFKNLNLNIKRTITILFYI